MAASSWKSVAPWSMLALNMYAIDWNKKRRWSNLLLSSRQPKKHFPLTQKKTFILVFDHSYSSWPWNIFWNTRFVQRNCFLYSVFFVLFVCLFVRLSMQWFFCLWLVLKLTQPLHLVRYKTQTTCNSDLVIAFSQACGQLIEFTLNGHWLLDLYLFSLHD